MAPVLPSSLSPHICILHSPDLTDLLTTSSLPPLPEILQSFSPVPQVTTRTTTLSAVTHTSFALRFSDMTEVEISCREDEEQRAVRTIDWISSRVNNKCAKWVEDLEKTEAHDSVRTPWWDEVRRCAEGDYAPSKTEGWNHPVAVILAVSTTAPNPLQAITALHLRTSELPPWVDTNYIRCTLIIHPQNSSLTNEETGALYNAVKKQYGLHSYLISLALPSPSSPLISLPLPPPRLPPPPPPDSPQLASTIPSIYGTLVDGSSIASVNGPSGVPVQTLRMCEQDIQQIAKFMREFVVSSLVPWMEKCVVEWNENYSSTRRLPSRLFSSTRRLFGSTNPTTSSHSSTSSVTSTSPTSHGYTGSQGSIIAGGGFSGPPLQQRRLAEFSTILGDFKLAVGVWESLRKEGKGGSDILPLLLAPSPASPLHVAHALSSIHPPTSELSPHTQLRALLYAIRWETGIDTRDFVGDVLEGDRWLVWAAGNAEEAPSALLLAHGALLSAKRRALRRSALWYLFAANRLEKCGIKPLTMYFLRRAHELYQAQPRKNLSPSFWESEGKSKSNLQGFNAIRSGIEHPLGRLLYTTGDIAGAVRFFLGLLQGIPTTSQTLELNDANGDATRPNTDKVFLEDFRVAFTHFKATSTDNAPLLDLKLPLSFCIPRRTRIRLSRDITYGSANEWERLEEDWETFWKIHGKEGLEKNGKASVDEIFWIDLVLRNPLDTQVNLTNLSVCAEEASSEASDSSRSPVDIEILEDITFDSQETRIIPVFIKSSRPISLAITNIKYDFLGLLPSSESLATRGRRLQETTLQLQNVMYAPDVIPKVDVEEARQNLSVDFIDHGDLILAQGECRKMNLRALNRGIKSVGEVWLVVGPKDKIWLDLDDHSIPESLKGNTSTETLHSNNSLAPLHPRRIPLEQIHTSSSLQPGESVDIPVILHLERLAEDDLCLLFVYREPGGNAFRSSRLTRHYEVKPIFEVSATSRPSKSLDHLFLVDLVLGNVTSSNTVELAQVTTVSPTWSSSPLSSRTLGALLPSQNTRLVFKADPWSDGHDTMQTFQFVSNKLRDMLHGHSIEASNPPPTDLFCTHVFKDTVRSMHNPATRYFISGEKRDAMFRTISSLHPHIPVSSYPYIFPLYNPTSLDFVIFWEIPTQKRTGYFLVTGLSLGAGHAFLKEIIEESEGSKVRRSMYAETRREKFEVVEAIRASEWNVEMDPIEVTVQDGVTFDHDFSKGSCHTTLAFTLRNYSLSRLSRFVMKFPSVAEAKLAPSSDILSPLFSGRLIYRGVLEPSESITIRPWVSFIKPGTYSLGGWRLETEVGEASQNTRWQTRYRYIQTSVEDRLSVTVRDCS